MDKNPTLRFVVDTACAKSTVAHQKPARSDDFPAGTGVVSVPIEVLARCFTPARNAAGEQLLVGDVQAFHEANER